MRRYAAMKKSILQYLFVMSCGLSLLLATPVHAVITCSSVSVTPLSFGSVSPQSSLTTAQATLSYTCANNSADVTASSSALLCFSLGNPGDPRSMVSGSNRLSYQIYQDAAQTVPWTSQFGGTTTPLKVPITLAKNGSTSGTATLYGVVLGGQTTAVPGAYINNFNTAATALTVTSVAGTTAPTNCVSTSFSAVWSFPVTATVSPQCTVTAGNNLNLGTVASSAINVAGNTTLNVNCSATTPYYIGLAPSNNNTGGAGNMNGSIPGNTDKVPYQLRSTPGSSGTIWGNTSTSTSVGNGVSGIGNGLPAAYTVYATVPSANYRPDSYRDTVTVIVNY